MKVTVAPASGWPCQYSLPWTGTRVGPAGCDDPQPANATIIPNNKSRMQRASWNWDKRLRNRNDLAVGHGGQPFEHGSPHLRGEEVDRAIGKRKVTAARVCAARIAPAGERAGCGLRNPSQSLAPVVQPA